MCQMGQMGQMCQMCQMCKFDHNRTLINHHRTSAIEIDYRTSANHHLLSIIYNLILARATTSLF